MIFWIFFNAFVLVMLALDLGVFHRKTHEISLKEALTWSKEKHKHQLLSFSAADQAEIQKLLKPMQDAYVKKVTAAGLPGDQILKEALSLKEKYEKQYKK